MPLFLGDENMGKKRSMRIKSKKRFFTALFGILLLLAIFGV